MSDQKLLWCIRWAAKQMEGKRRKNNNRDYFGDHCMKLLGLVACDSEYGNNVEAAMIIVCHDVVEDCTENDTDKERQDLYDEIISKFGLEVAEGVYDLTNEFTKKRYPELNRYERKQRELHRLKKLGARSKRLKLYDRYVNLCDMIDDADWNTNYARESWDLSVQLMSPNNHRIGLKVLNLAAKILKRENNDGTG